MKTVHSNENHAYEKAKEKVESIKSFYNNVLAYCIVIPILAYINYRTVHFPWVLFPAFGWGFGLVVNGLYAYDYSPILGRKWEERKIKQFMKEQ